MQNDYSVVCGTIPELMVFKYSLRSLLFTHNA